MTPAQARLLRHLARVDWLRAGQRLLVFCREIRGDNAALINQDHAQSLERAQRLKQTIENFAQRVTR